MEIPVPLIEPDDLWLMQYGYDSRMTYRTCECGARHLATYGNDADVLHCQCYRCGKSPDIEWGNPQS